MTIALSRNNNKFLIRYFEIIGIVVIFLCLGTMAYSFCQGGAASWKLINNSGTVADSNLVLERDGVNGNKDISMEGEFPAAPVPAPTSPDSGINTVFGLWVFLTLLIGIGIIISILYMLNNDELGLEPLVAIIIMIVTEVVITFFLSSIW
jgi:hypothetical protein